MTLNSTGRPPGRRRRGSAGTPRTLARSAGAWRTWSCRGRSEELLQGHREMYIIHGNQMYRLLRTGATTS